MHKDYKPSQEEYDYILSKILSEIESPSPIYNNQQALGYAKPRFLPNGNLDIVRITKDTTQENRIYIFTKDTDKYTCDDGNYSIVFAYNSTDDSIHVMIWPKTYVRLSIWSENLNYEQMKSFTKLGTYEGRSKGDKRKHGNTYHENSHISIYYDEANVPGTFEDNINSMLNYIETDAEGIMKLSQNSEIFMNVSSKQHFAYTWGPSLTSEMIAKLAKYNIKFDYDFGIYGLPENIFIT